MNADAIPSGLMKGGQSAFAAIQEIVAQLMADPTTDWSRVDIEALRQHLIDMDNVTLRARVDVQKVEGGARFEATSKDAAVTSSIRATVPAHAATMDGAQGWTMQASEITGGAAVTVTGGDPDRIRALRVHWRDDGWHISRHIGEHLRANQSNAPAVLHLSFGVRSFTARRDPDTC